MKFLGLIFVLLLSYNAFSKHETIETSPKTAIGVIFKVESNEILKNPKFKKLTKEAGLHFDNYFPRAKVISLKVKEATTQLNHLEAFCHKISNFPKVETCELDYLLEPQNRELSTGQEKVAPCPQEQSQLSNLDSIATFTDIITDKLGECEFFPNSPIEDHPTDLSGYWAQEYTGADLLRRRIEAHHPPFHLRKNLIGIWDTNFQNDHGTRVSNLIAGPYPTAVIPHDSTLGYVNTGHVSDYVEAYEEKSHRCQESGRCTRYINNSMRWSNSSIIADAVSGLVDEVGSVFVTAAGNSNDGQLTELAKRDLARERRLLLVSSLSPVGQPSWFTNYAPEVSIAAPSDRLILSHHTDGSPIRFGGTSGAAPQVTGALAAFELITDYSLSTEESRLLLERTALPIPSLPSPNNLGAGMLNTYFIGDLSFRLNESCNNLETKQSCIEAALQDPATFARNQDISILEELGDFFPACGTPPQEELNSKSSCKDRKAFLERLRSLANISDQPDLFSAIACIYEGEGFTENAEFYRRLAERMNQINQQSIDETSPIWSHVDDSEFVQQLIEGNQEIARYVLLHPHWEDHPNNDREFMLAVVASDAWALEFASEELINDREFMLAAVVSNAWALEFASKELRSDPEFMLAAVASRGWALKFASEELRGDRELVLAAVSSSGTALRYASEELRGNRELVLAAVSSSGTALRYAPEELRNDREFMLAAVTSNGWALQFVSEELRGDREVVLTAVASDGWALQFASEKLRGDREVVLTAVASDDLALRFASQELRNDPEIRAAAGRP